MRPRGQRVGIWGLVLAADLLLYFFVPAARHVAGILIVGLTWGLGVTLLGGLPGFSWLDKPIFGAGRSEIR